MVDVAHPQKLSLNRQFQNGIGCKAFLLLEEAVKVLLSFLDDALGILLLLFRGIFERRSDGASDHGFELLFLLYFVSVEGN